MRNGQNRSDSTAPLITILMKFIQLSYAPLILALLSAGCIPIRTNEVSFVQNWDTVRVLKNPHKGWYHHLLDNGVHKYAIEDDSIFASFPGMDHLYLRLAWSFLEPREGEFNWHYIDGVVEKYVPQGYNISFRISCSETGRYPDSVGEELEGVQYATPGWVRKAGAEGTVVQTLGSEKHLTWVPKWDDPVFLEKLDQFHKAFAARYDGQPWVIYVDIGSIGDWGEGHTSFTTRVPPTAAEVKANMDIYLNNYKKTQIVVCDGYFTVGKSKDEEQQLYQYAVSHGMTIRDDSPLVDYYVRNHLDTWTVTQPHFYDPLYLSKPIVFELQHYHIVKRDGNWLGKSGAEMIPAYGYSGAYIMRKAIETMRATYIGYHGYAEEWLADNPDLTNELANLCGYWYFPVRSFFPSTLDRDENVFSIEWLNKGVAPAYKPFDLLLRFESENPNESFELLPEGSGNRNWLPGVHETEIYQVGIPPDIKKGKYIMKFRLAEQTGKGIRPVHVGVSEAVIDKEGFIEIGRVRIK
jgi:hypothetical protein